MRIYPAIVMIIGMFWLSACRSPVEKNLIGADSMKVIMLDMMKADEWYNKISGNDSTAAKKRKDIHLYEQVFAVHNTTREQFYKTLKYYESRPISFRVLLDSLETHAIRERAKVSAIKPN